MVRGACAAIVLSLSLMGCEGVGDDERRAESLVGYRADDGGFEVEYFSPPWEQVAADGESLELAVPSALFGVSLDGAEPTHVFTIAYVDMQSRLDELTEDVDLPEADTDFGATGGIPDGLDVPDEGPIPDYLLTVDLREPGAVALAELDHLLVAQKANLDQPLEPFVTRSRRGGLVYQVVLDPGVFVRVFYFPARRSVVRAVFASAFNLATSDVDDMAARIHTGGEEAP